MTRPPTDDEREERIDNEIIVDTYGPEERAMGWYNYLNDNMQFPFQAQCIASYTTSPLEPGDKVEVVGLASDDECERDMLVLIRWKSRKLAVPLSQLEGVQVGEETEQAMGDWRYWVERGYEF